MNERSVGICVKVAEEGGVVLGSGGAEMLEQKNWSHGVMITTSRQTFLWVFYEIIFGWFERSEGRFLQTDP